MPSSTASAHLVLPGLLWPAQAMRDLVFDLDMPALSAILGLGRRQVRAMDGGMHAWLARCAGVAALPAAALRLKAAGLEAGGACICLDPVHLRLEKTQLVLEDPAALALDPEEAQALAATLAPLIVELGRIEVAHPGEWHLRLAAATPLATTPLTDAIGYNAMALTPIGGNARDWRRLLNEIQVTLHTHPVNAARVARGMRTVNSLWPWGEGELPPAGSTAWRHIVADASLWQGLAAHLGCTHQSLPSRYQPLAGASLYVDASLDAAGREGDAMRWREALLAQEARWFAPMLAAWRSGELAEIHVHGGGAERSVHLHLARGDRLRFWRKPAPLETLGN